MPAIISGKVLVTGINGFAAMWTAKALLEQGFSVRGTVRSTAKGAHPRDYFKSYSDKVEVVVVDDITKDGAFDDAVRGVDAVVHLASAFHVSAKEPDDIIGPAVKGTITALESALKKGDKVKRFVQVSSISAVADLYPTKPTVFTEKDWNDHAIQLVEELGNKASGRDMYDASKTLSERAAWEFVERNKDVKYDLVSINPGFILGPALQEANTPQDLNTSIAVFFLAVAGQLDPQTLTTPFSSWVDIRDYVQSIIAALKTEEAGGERFLVTSESFCWQDWISVIRKFDPTVTLGIQGWKRSDSVYNIDFDTTKSQKVLGVTYHSWDECARSVMDYFKEKGWWGKAAKTV